MPVTERITHSPEETTMFGRELAKSLRAPLLVLLSGDLGAGKTTLTKGIVSGLGAAREEDVTSPTFTLVHVFRPGRLTETGAERSSFSEKQRSFDPAAGAQAAPSQVAADTTAPAATAAGEPVKIYHVDLYRIESFQGLESLGLEDALDERAIIIIEWSERFSLRSDWPRLRIHLEHLDMDSPDADSRRITVTGPDLSQSR